MIPTGGCTIRVISMHNDSRSSRRLLATRYREIRESFRSDAQYVHLGRFQCIADRLAHVIGYDFSSIVGRCA